MSCFRSGVMPNTRAEIQRAYRQRKKEREGEAYAEKERKRVKKYYTPIAQRSKKDAHTRRDSVRGWVQAHRLKKKEAEQDEAANGAPSNVNGETAVTSTTLDSEIPSANTPLTVKMPFMAPTLGETKGRKRVKREAARLREELRKTENEAEFWRKKYQACEKKFSRLSNKMEKGNLKSKHIAATADELTPKKRTAAELRAEGLSPSKVPKIAKKILMANVLTDELKTAVKTEGTKGKTMIKQIVPGPILQKYRVKAQLSSHIQINRRNLKFTQNKLEASSRRQCSKNCLRRKMAVFVFLDRDDNSRQMPGKKDTKKSEGEQKQAKVLNDSMKNLFCKFVSENPHANISIATFCRLRPKHFFLTRYLSRNRCLCQKHQKNGPLSQGGKKQWLQCTIQPRRICQETRGVWT